jgi:hypothetical protein
MSTRSRPGKTRPVDSEDEAKQRIAQARIEQLNGLIRDANGTLSDLRKEIKKAERLTADAITAKIEEQLKKALSELGDATTKTLSEVTEIIFRRFDGLTNELLGEDSPRNTPLKDLLCAADARDAAKEAIERLGFEFRQATLDNGERAVVLTRDGELV